jgi:hypothetical protein
MHTLYDRMEICLLKISYVHRTRTHKCIILANPTCVSCALHVRVCVCVCVCVGIFMSVKQGHVLVVSYVNLHTVLNKGTYLSVKQGHVLFWYLS